MLKLVGIHGKLGSGKSTVARMIAAHAQQKKIPAKIHAFAVPLKELCAEVYDYPHELNYADGGKAVRPAWASFPHEQKIFYPAISATMFQRSMPSGYSDFVQHMDQKLVDLNAHIAQKFDVIHNVKREPITVGRILQTVGQAFRDVMGEDHWVDLFLGEMYDSSRSKRVVIVEDVRYQNEARALMARGAKLINVTRSGMGGDSRDALHPSEIGLDRFEGWAYTIVNNGDERALEEMVRAITDQLF
jgi:hypothetical protein